MKKGFLFIIALVFAFFAFCGFYAKADAITLTMTDGASVRTEGTYQGLRFLASVDTLEGASEHGFYIALGEHSLSNMRTAIEADSATVGGNKLVKRQALGEETTFAVTIYDITQEYYTAGITAVAYVKVGDDYTLDKVVTKNIAEVTMGALNAGETAPLLTTVKNYISANYKKAYDSYDKGFTIDNAAYCYDPEELGQLFVADWNKFVDEEDEIASITSNTKAKAASLTYKNNDGADFYYSAKWTKWSDTISTTNISESNLYRFFNDSFYGEKWGWLLTIMRVAENDAANAAWQSIAVQGDGTNGTKSLYAGQHLAISIVGFFTKQKMSYGYIGVDFASSKRSMYNNLYTGSYANTTVYNSYLSEHPLYEIGDTVNLPAERTPETGYDWVSYKLNTTPYEAESSYTVTSADVRFNPIFELHNYSITYYDGETPLDLSPSTYTIVTDTFSLPNYEKDSYVFEGWYDNELLEGDPITEIARGSHDNMELYAKTTYTPYATVNVTFDLNGGNWSLSDIVENNTPTKTIVATYYNSYQGNGYDISFVENTSQSTYWVYIVLAATDVENVYRIIGKANGSANLPASYDAVISYHTACTSDYFNDVKAIYSGSNIGQYITVENKPNTSGGSKNITIKLFPSTVLTANHVKNMNEPASLPTPIKNGYEFAGWLNSISSNVDSSFPGYNPNPGDITYTAQWDAIDNMALSSNDSRVLGLIGTPDIIVNADPTYSSGSFNVNGRGYTAGKDLFANISDAVAAVKGLGNTIYVFAGTYNDVFTITAKQLTIVGPNEGLDARNLASRATEAIITGKITLATTDKNITISGFKFTGNGQIFTTSSASASDKIGVEGFNYKYNYVDKGDNTTPAILLDDGRKVHAKDILVEYCYFTAPSLAQVYNNVTGIIVTYDNRNVTIRNNDFYNIPLNAIGLYNTSTGNGATGDVIVTGNTFTNITKSALWVAKHIPFDSNRTIRVANNVFTDVAGGACVDFETSDTSSYVEYVIEKNIFKNVVKCFWGNTNPGMIFRDNVVYKYASQVYVARNGSTTDPLDCERNLYIDSDETTVITAPKGNGFTFHGNSVTTINENTNNYATKEAYTSTTGIELN